MTTTNHPTSYYDALDEALIGRGHYIISQALEIAITQLEAVDDPYKEESNIAEMKYFRKNIWNFPQERIVKAASLLPLLRRLDKLEQR